KKESEEEEEEEEEQVIKISKKEIPHIRQRYPNLDQGTFLVKSITDINEFQDENKEACYTYVFQSQKKKEGKATVSRSYLDLSEVSPHINRAKVFTLKRDTIKDLFCPNAFYNICRYSNLKRVIFNETSLCNKNHQWVADDRSILHNGGEFFQVAMEFYY